MDFNRIEYLITWYFNYYTKFIVNGVYTIIGIIAMLTVIIFALVFAHNEYQEYKRKHNKKDYYE